MNEALGGKPCESCGSKSLLSFHRPQFFHDILNLETSSSQWYPFGTPQISGRLCQGCWTYWRKYGGLKYPSRLGK